MKRLHALAAAGAVAAGTVLAALAVAAPARADTQICDQFGSTTIAGGRYVVQNNNWGDTTQQCINVTSTGFSVASASHNKAQNGAPGAYPSVYAGCHYANCSTGSGLPMQTSNSQFGTIQTSVSMSYPGNGSVFDASYDIWFDPTPRTNGQNTGAELMVWLNHTGSVQPVGSKVGTATIAGATWDVWFGNSGWNVISYVRQQTTNSVSFNVSSFWSDIVSRGYGQTAWYMTSVQAGFEPWVNGTGLAVTNFSYSLGGAQASPSPTAAATNPGGEACRVTYAPQQWQGGFTANVTVANTGTGALNGWTLTFAFPGSQQITSAWNATVSQSGAAVTARSLAFNGTLAPGASTSFGFQGTWSSSNPSPTSFSVNGSACTA
ncbi:MAG TPA: cellulose binding domain-containing protein [Rugosimonospora sp.]|nr:cellulose binding domain-containing protein [Rugosimonospora sp.]